MKAIAKSAPYFSAYPLKVITENANENPNLEPYLKALLNSKTQSVKRTKVFPMVNPYPAEQQIPAPVHHSQSKPAVEPGGVEWFSNYE